VIVAHPNFAAMYATCTRKVKTDRRDARARAEPCRLVHPQHRAAQPVIPRHLVPEPIRRRTGTRGSTASTRWAARSVIRGPPQLGHRARPSRGNGRIANTSTLRRRGRPLRGPRPRDMRGQTRTLASRGADATAAPAHIAGRSEESTLNFTVT
jgi:hypothetical protein